MGHAYTGHNYIGHTYIGLSLSFMGHYSSATAAIYSWPTTALFMAYWFLGNAHICTRIYAHVCAHVYVYAHVCAHIYAHV